MEEKRTEATDKLLEEIKQLKNDYKEIEKENKKQQRELTRLKNQIERSKTFAETKESMNKALSSQRTALERYLNLVMENFPAIVLLLNEKNCAVYATDAFLKSCRIPAFALIKEKHFRPLLEPFVDNVAMLHLDEIYSELFTQGGTRSFSAKADFAQSGEDRIFNVQITPMLTSSGQARGSMIFFYDTTEITLARHEAERANAAKSDFLAMVSHEIRTPMNAIMGVSDMLRDTKLNSKQLEYLHNIQNASAMLLNLINDILDFSKIEAGKLSLAEEYFELDVFLDRLQSMFRLLFERKGIKFSSNFAPDLPVVVCGDEERIRQILNNLLNNALKYTEKGSAALSAKILPNGQIAFSVQDTGIGIKDDAMPKLFNAFEQLDMVRNKKISGTGLGLAISKRLCDMIGGTITVESKYGEGSTFTVVLPLKFGSRSNLPNPTYYVADFSAPQAKVLLVDDIDINLEITAYMLSRYQVKSDLAHSGQQALSLAEKNNYDIVFMDHMMPEMDGMQAMQAMRTMQNVPQNQPIVALTANAMSDAVEMFLTNGFDDFLAKPVEDDSLSQCLLKWLPKDKIINKETV